MRRFAVPGIIAAIAVALLAVLAYGVSENGTNNSLDNAVARHDYVEVPDATVRLASLTSSHPADLADLRGHPVLVNMFAGWCVECQQEMAVVGRAQRMLAAHGGTVVGVTWQDTPSDALGFLRAYHVAYPAFADWSGTLASGLGVTGVPESFLLNGRGQVVALQRYPITDQWLAQNLRKAFASGA